MLTYKENIEKAVLFLVLWIIAGLLYFSILLAAQDYYGYPGSIFASLQSMSGGLFWSLIAWLIIAMTVLASMAYNWMLIRAAKSGKHIPISRIRDNSEFLCLEDCMHGLYLIMGHEEFYLVKSAQRLSLGVKYRMIDGQVHHSC